MGSVKKFNQYIKESNDNLTETEIREFIKEKFADFRDDLVLNINNKFPLDTMDISDKDDEKILELSNQIIDIYVKNTVKNIKNFDKFWDKDEIKVGDKVYFKSILYHVDKIENGKIYDKDRDELIPIEKVTKRKK